MALERWKNTSAPKGAIRRISEPETEGWRENEQRGDLRQDRRVVNEEQVAV